MTFLLTFLAATRYWVNKIQKKIKLVKLGYQRKVDIFFPEGLFSPFCFVFRMLNDRGVKISSCYTKDTKGKKKKKGTLPYSISQKCPLLQ